MRSAMEQGVCVSTSTLETLLDYVFEQLGLAESPNGVPVGMHVCERA